MSKLGNFAQLLTKIFGLIGSLFLLICSLDLLFAAFRLLDGKDMGKKGSKDIEQRIEVVVVVDSCS